MKTWLERLLLILIGLTFFVPLIMLPKSFIFPFIVPKIVVFRTLVMLMFGVFALLLAAYPERFRLRFSPVSVAVLVYLASFALSTLLGVDPYHSFWDNHERMLGLFTIIHYALYYVVITAAIRSRRDWQIILRVFLFAGAAVMLIGVWQRFVNPEFFLNQSGSRVAATLGNPIYVGGYGLFLAFLGAWLSVKETARGWKVFAAVSGTLGFIGIFLSGTRGSMLGFLVGAGVVGAILLWTLGGKSSAVRRGVPVAGVILAVLLGALFMFRETTFVQKIPALGPLLNASLKEGTANTRLMAWGIAVDAWKERPIFGWGPNNYFYAFNKYYRPEFLRHGWGETWFDNAHNIFMNTLAVQGMIGILAYIGLFGTVLVVLYKKYRGGAIDAPTGAIIAGFFIAHLAQNAFVFENPTSYLYFFFMLALVNRLPHEEEPSAPRTAESRVSRPLAGAVGLLVFLIIFMTNVNAARANRSALRLLRSLYQNDDPAGHFERTMAIPTPHIDDIRSDFGRTVIQLAPKYVEQGQGETARKLLEFADNEFNKNRAIHPMDIRTHLQQSQLAELAAKLFQNVDYLLASERALTEALALSPKRQQVLYTLAAVKLTLRKSDEAIALMERTVADDPTIGDGWWRLAYFYKEADQIEKAQETVARARALGVAFDEQGKNLMSQILPES